MPPNNKQVAPRHIHKFVNRMPGLCVAEKIGFEDVSAPKRRFGVTAEPKGSVARKRGQRLSYKSTRRGASTTICGLS